jgi:hypothetical protein
MTPAAGCGLTSVTVAVTESVLPHATDTIVVVTPGSTGFGEADTASTVKRGAG